MIARSTLATLVICLTFLSASNVLAKDSGKIIVMPIDINNQSLENGAAVIEEILLDYFENIRSVQLISSEQKEALAGEETGNRLDIIRTVTAKLDSTQALIFSLSRFQERIGDQYSVEDPAALAFEFKLIDTKDGRVTCSGRYDETQKSLTENILNFPQAMKRGFKWLTVEQLAKEAVSDRFGTCPALTSISTQ